MEWNSPDLNSWPARLVMRMGKKARKDKEYSRQVVEERNAREEARHEQRRLQHAQKNGYQPRKLQKKGRKNDQPDINELGEREYSIFSEASTLVEVQRAGRKDHTDLLHGLSHEGDAFGDERRRPTLTDEDEYVPFSARHEVMVASLPSDVWRLIASYLNPCDVARLACSSKTLRRKMGLDAPFEILNDPTNKDHKIAFLDDLDRKLAWHLLCFPCARYHIRLNPGNETLKADFVNNPLFLCPNATTSQLPRMRLTHGRQLPYSFVQLPLRASRYGTFHGLEPSALSRRWKCKDSTWSHQSRFLVSEDHLLMRVVSKSLTLPGYLLTESSSRHLLFDREEYTPYFSVCAHWRDGDLTAICKCMLAHVPSPPESFVQQIRSGSAFHREKARTNYLVRGCDWCRPARRCPECPSEYLVEIHMVEDLKDTERPIKHAIVVTRWSDLGDGRSPYTSVEWRAINGLNEGEKAELLGEERFKSFVEIGRRAISGRFESSASGMIPGQRMVSLNPSKVRKGEEGNTWY